MSAVASQVTAEQRSAEPSMEEILASIRKIIAEDQKVLESKSAEVVAPATEEVAPATGEGENILDLATLAPAAETLVVEEARVVAPPAPAPVIAETVAPAPVYQPDERLISQDAAQATSAAFQSLANTVFTQQARTMDDLVAEMLRPMLTAWLNDHLPALVERLVKAEIERVARGGR